MYSVIYLAIGPILVMTGAIVLLYMLVHYFKTENSHLTQKKTTHIIECEKCGKKLRVPTVTGTIKVTCPTCRHAFSHG